MKLSSLRKKYPDHCLIIRPTAHNDSGQVIEGELLAVGKTRKEAFARLKSKPQKVATFYTAKVPPMASGGQPITSPQEIK